MFDSRDAFSYSTSSATDATPMNGDQGDGDPLDSQSGIRRIGDRLAKARR